MLTLEDDVLPPPEGLLQLYESMNKYDVVQGLYWAKGELGQPMIYGDINDPVINFRPQFPEDGKDLHECYGLGMGFNLFKLDMFKHVPEPWFTTLQFYDPTEGAKGISQDLFFYQNAWKLGYRFACDTRIKCGHIEFNEDYPCNGFVW